MTPEASPSFPLLLPRPPWPAVPPHQMQLCGLTQGTYHPPAPTYSASPFFPFTSHLPPPFLPETLPDHLTLHPSKVRGPLSGVSHQHASLRCVCLYAGLLPIKLGAPLKSSTCKPVSVPRTSSCSRGLSIH